MKNESQKAWILRFGPAIIMMGLIFIASAIPGSDLPKLGGMDALAKKAGHMAGYALLAATYFHALNNGKRITRMQYIAAICLVVLYSISDEWHQSFTPGRSPASLDVCIDTIGGVIGTLVYRFCRMTKYE